MNDLENTDVDVIQVDESDVQPSSLESFSSAWPVSFKQIKLTDF